MSLAKENQIIDCETYEEGEIIDVDSLEPISSDEEVNLIERIRDLEARNAELEKLAALAKEERTKFNYKGDFVQLSSDDEVDDRNTRRRVVRIHRSPIRSRRRSPSPNHRRRRRSASPAYTNRNGKYIRSRYSAATRHRPRLDHKRDVRVKRKRPRRRSSADNQSINLTESLEAACRHNENGRRRDEHPLAKRLKLHEEHSNKENDSEDDEELIALRLQALQSKQEVKELTNEFNNKTEPAQDAPGEDDDEYELRMIALKSAITKKAETRKMQNRKPYSPTDELVPANVSPLPLCVESDNESNNNMEISPTDSPLLDDAVLQPIDMEIATPDNASNSPTFFQMDDSNSIPVPMSISDQKDLENQFADSPVSSTNMPTTTHPTIVTTKAGLPIGLVSLPVQEEIKENLGKRQNTRSPSNLIVIQPTTPKIEPKRDQVRTRRGKRRRPMKQSAVLKVQNSEKQPTSPTDDSEEAALRSFLLATLKNPQKVKTATVTSSQPCTRPETPTPMGERTTQDDSIDLKKVVKRLNDDSKDSLLNIEDNLKRAAKRFKDQTVLTEQEQNVIESSLDKILGDGFEVKETKQPVDFKNVVERLKKKNSEQSPSRIEPPPPPPTISTQECVDNQALPTPPTVTPPPPLQEKVVEKIVDKPKNASISHNLTPKQITTAMVDIKAAKPALQKKLTAPVIMKRKVKTKSSIVNVPFQPKPPTLPLKPAIPSSSKAQPSQSPLSPLPGPSRLITDYESYSRPVNKLIITLGDSSSESSSDENDENISHERLTESGVQSKLASPSHVVEYSIPNNMSHDADESNSGETTADKTSDDPLFEIKLDQFLKQARAKVEVPEEIKIKDEVKKTTPSQQKIIKPTIKKEPDDKPSIPATPTSLKHLPISTQLEYKALVAKMQILEKQRNLRQRFKNAKTSTQNGSEKSIQVPLTANRSPSPCRVLQLNTPNSNDTPPITSTPKDKNCTVPAEESKLDKITPELSDVRPVETPSVPVPIGPLSMEEKLAKMSDAARARMLERSETSFAQHSQVFLDELKSFIVNIEGAYEEKRKQVLLELEVEKLRAQLDAAQAKLDEQKKKVSTIFPTVTQKHKKILASRDKYVRLGKCCNKIGNVVKGTDYQHQTQVKTEICEKLQVLGVKTKELKQVRQRIIDEQSKQPSVEILVPKVSVPEVLVPKVSVQETPTEEISKPEEEQKTDMKSSYKSVLDCLGAKSNTEDPDGILCPFEIDGQCEDSSCKYKHLMAR